MLNKLNNPLLAVFTLVCVLWLGWVSYTPETGYTHSVFDVLRPRYNEQQAAALKDLYNITDQEIAAPVRIFDEP